MEAPRPKIRFPEKLRFLFQPAPYKVTHGGRAGLKSMNYAAALVLLGASTSLRVLCCREIQKAIKDSVHQDLSDAIHRQGLDQYYRILDNEIRGRHNGTFFIFEGLKSNASSIKSKAGLNIAWVEEAEGVSKVSWEYLEPTIRTPWLLPLQFFPPGMVFTPEQYEANGVWVDPEIWVTFNPNDATDETFVKFIGGDPPPPGWEPPTGAVIVETNWRDADALGWFPNNLRQQKDYLKKTDYDAYLHVWEGKPRKMSAAQILRGKFVKEWFTPEGDWNGPYQGVDFGFAADPLAGVRCWVHAQRLYIEYEAVGFGVETDDTPSTLSAIPHFADHVSRADCARPETISYCRRHGDPFMIPCKKWQGSVADGISYLRQEFVQIVVHPRCVQTLQEMRLWSYQIDPNTQAILPKPEDKNNHCIDAIRYAIGPLIEGKVKLPACWWRRWVVKTPEEKHAFDDSITVKMVVMTMDPVKEESAELRAVFQLWGMVGVAKICLLKEEDCFGLLPEAVAEAERFWNESLAVRGREKPPTEFWAESKAVGSTLIDLLRAKRIPAREWDSTDDPLTVDPAWRAKQASIQLEAGRVYVPEGPCLVVEEVEGPSTNAATLAILIWNQRGGGR